MSSEERPVTEEELARIPYFFSNLEYSIKNNYYFGILGGLYFFGDFPEGPWTDADSNPLDDASYLSRIPDSQHISNVSLKLLTGSYRNKPVRFSISQNRWVYQNNHPVHFRTSQSQTPQSSVPGTPAPSGPSHLPTPQTAGTSLAPQRQPSPSSRAQQKLPVQPVPVQAPPIQAPVPVHPAGLPPAAPPVNPVMAAPANPKILGTLPESFDGKPEKAENFLAQLKNYYYLNTDVFADESRRVSAALTHFKSGTPAGEWAQDRANAALAVTPIDFGTWADFLDAFTKHFIPVDSQLESSVHMHNMRQGNKTFNEWYQQWYTHAARAGVDERTKMFAFRRNLNQALHTKIIALHPQPTTLPDLVAKARDFDRVYQLYNSPAFYQKDKGARVRGSTTEDAAQINFSSTPQSSTQQRGPISQAEHDRCFKDKLCLYCGKPGHIAKECRAKKNQKRPGIAPPKVHAATTQEPQMEENPPDSLQISSFRVPSPFSYDMGIVRPKSAPQDF